MTCTARAGTRLAATRVSVRCSGLYWHLMGAIWLVLLAGLASILLVRRTSPRHWWPLIPSALLTLAIAFSHSMRWQNNAAKTVTAKLRAPLITTVSIGISSSLPVRNPVQMGSRSRRRSSSSSRVRVPARKSAAADRI